MTAEIAFVFLLILVAGGLMASNRVRYDLVALLVVLALILGDILTVGEAFSGFGSTVVILVACLLIVGEMLDRTGVARAVGDLILKHGGKNEVRLLVLIMISAAVLGSLMSSTAVVAIFIPIVMQVAAKTGLDKARMLLPMSYAALISGMLTLIATPPNLIVSDELAARGFEPLGFFSFLPMGIVVLAVTILYILLWGRFQLRSPAVDQMPGTTTTKATLFDIWERFGMNDTARVVDVVHPLSDAQKEVIQTGGRRVLGRLRRSAHGARIPVLFLPGMDIIPGDRLLISGTAEDLAPLAQMAFLERADRSQFRPQDWIGTFGIAEVLVYPESDFVGKPATALEDWSSDIRVLGLLSTGSTEPKPLTAPMKPTDRLLIAGMWDDLDHVLSSHDPLVRLNEPRERHEAAPAQDKFMISIGILLAMVALTLFDIVPITVAVVLAAIAAVFFRTMSAEQAYGSVNLSSLVLIAGMLPLADALNQTGGSALIVSGLLDVVGDSDPRAMMAALFLLTAVLGLVLSNTASAVLVAPIAITAAAALEISPYPLAICVLFAASAAFSTPISTPVVTLVVAPGGYRFGDFLKLGLPLTLLVGVMAVLLAPIFFPY